LCVAKRNSFLVFFQGGQQKVKLVTSFSIPLSNDANLTVNAPESNPMAINANTGQALNAIMITVSTTTTTSSTTTTTRASSNTTERELQVKFSQLMKLGFNYEDLQKQHLSF
jgi:hypothetical protein